MEVGRTTGPAASVSERNFALFVPLLSGLWLWVDGPAITGAVDGGSESNNSTRNARRVGRERAEEHRGLEEGEGHLEDARIERLFGVAHR